MLEAIDRTLTIIGASIIFSFVWCLALIELWSRLRRALGRVCRRNGAEARSGESLPEVAFGAYPPHPPGINHVPVSSGRSW